jgi:hypothetical protein
MKAVRDDTYTDALQPEKMTADLIAWHDWRNRPDGLLADARKIGDLMLGLDPP